MQARVSALAVGMVAPIGGTLSRCAGMPVGPLNSVRPAAVAERYYRALRSRVCSSVYAGGVISTVWAP
jgi:hypothetical protein